MNRIYSLIFNRSLGVMQVASELASHVDGGSAAADDTASAPLMRHRLSIAMGLALMALAAPSFAWAQSITTSGAVITANPQPSTGNWDMGYMQIATSGSTGSMTITGGAQATATADAISLIGGEEGQAGSLLVTGIGSSMAFSSAVYMGDSGGSGSLVVSDGAHVNAQSLAAAVHGGSADITVTGEGSTLTTAQDIGLGGQGVGKLTIAERSTVSASSVGVYYAGGTSTLVIGADAGSAAVAPGTLNAASLLTVGGATGSLIFNHTSNAYSFAPLISGGWSVSALAGTTALSAANTYTGATSIGSAATLILAGTGSIGSSASVTDDGLLDITGATGGASIGTLRGAGTIFLGNKKLSLSAGNSVFSGTITGSSAGSVAVTGAGTYATLLGNLSYGGGTSVASGSVLVLASPTAISTAGNIANAGQLLLAPQSGGVTFSGSITGAGGVIASIANAPITITKAQNYTGPTDIQGGTLSLQGAGSLSSSGVQFDQVSASEALDVSASTSPAVAYLTGGAGNVILGSNTFTLASLNSDYHIFGGVISGAGGLSLLRGMQLLTGANTYTGMTAIGSGAYLQIGNAGTSGSIAGNVLDNGTLAFNRSNALAYGGSISGTGSLNQSGSGTTTLSGALTYTGATSILAGTLALSNSATLASSSAVTDLGTLDISGTTNGALVKSISGTGGVALGSKTLTVTQATGMLSGAITGDGGLTIMSGTQSLSGANSYTGTTELTGNLTVSNGGTIAPSSGGTVRVDNGLFSVVGSTSSLSTPGYVYVGNGGTGTFLLAGGTQSRAFAVDLGEGATDTGSLALSGGSSLTLSDRINIGYSGKGMLSITGGSVLNVGSYLSIGNANGSTGTVLVDGIGSALTETATGLAVGTHGASTTGTLTISNGAMVTAPTAAVGQDGSTGTLNIGAPAGTSAVLPGTLVTGDGKLTLGNGAGHLVFNYSGNGITFSQAIIGSGTVDLLANSTIFTGNSTYTGTTTIASGAALQVGNGTSGSIVSNVVDNGQLMFLANAPKTYTGVISGAGLLFVGGATGGKLTLTRTSTVSGTAYLSTAGLALSGQGSIANMAVKSTNANLDISGVTAPSASIRDLGGTGSVTLGSKTLNLTAAQSAYNGIISGAGALNVTTGPGLVMQLGGNNTYTGGTTITTGSTLYVGNGTAGSIVGPVVNNGQLWFMRSDATTFAGVISGTGDLLQVGGSLTLTGKSLYTGATLLGGNLALVGGASLAASSGVLDQTSFDISANGDTSIRDLSGRGAVVLGNNKLILTNAVSAFDGVISGTGGLEVRSGKMTLSKDQTYTGLTTISGGTLEVGNGMSAAGSLAGDVLNNGALTFSHAGSNTYAGAISGTGTVLVGGGTEVLSGTSTFSGATQVSSNATLALSGTGGIAGSSVVDVDGALDISGTSAGASVTSLAGTGVVALGGETLTLTQASDMFAGVLTGTGGLTVAGGTATLTGTNTYTGTTSILDGATLALKGDGSLFNSAVLDDGTLDVSHANLGVALGSLSGNGVLILGSQGMTLSDANNTFSGSIQGTGGFTVTGGTQTLGGESTFTGDVSIADGATLALVGDGSVSAASGVEAAGTFDISGTNNGTSISTLYGNGSVVLGSKTLTLTDANDIFGGDIAGTGGLTLAAGTEVLTGSNSYTGVTTIDSGASLVLSGAGSIAGTSVLNDAGTFDISAANADVSVGSLAGNGGVALGNNTLTVTAADDTFAGAVDGAGGLTVSGGTQTLTGANSYTGATGIAAGATLALTGAGSIATTSGVADDGSFDISGTTAGATIKTLSGNGTVALGAQTLTLASAADAFGGVIAGSGGITVAAGTEVLTGNSTFTGTTTIARGATVQLGNGGTTGAIAGNVASDGNLVFDRSDDLDYAGTVSGTGSVIKRNNDTVLLSGASTYTGGTTLEAGTLAIGNADAIGTGQLDMAEFTTIAFGNSFTLANHITMSGDPTVDVGSGVTTTLSGGIADGTESGDLVKTGLGTLVLAGNNTYTGSTEVANGVLDVQGSAVSAATVDSGASLLGVGSVGGLNLLDGATVAPGGDTIGKLTVNGNVRFAAGSHYQLNGDDTGASDTIHATGSATLAGGSVVGVLAGANWSTSTRYTILSADGGLSGTFADATSNLAFLKTSLSYDANHAYLTLARNNVDFASVGTTGNQVSTGTAVQSLGDTSAVYNAVLDLDAPAARAVFADLSAASLASSRAAVLTDSRYVRDAIGNHLQGVDDASQASGQGSVWTSTWGHWGKDVGDANQGRQTTDGSGLLVGADRDLGGARLGAVIGHGQLSTRNGTDDAHGTSDHVGIYAASDIGPWELQGGAAHSWYRMTSHRTIASGDFGGSADARYDTGVTQAYADAGFRIDMGPGSVTPFVNVARTWQHQDQISEHGNLGALDVQANGTAVNAGTAGVRGSFSPSKAVELHASLGYQHAWGDLRSTDTQRFASGGDSFTVAGVPVARNAGIADVGMKFMLRSNVSVDASYHGQFGGETKDQSARLSLNVSF